MNGLGLLGLAAGVALVGATAWLRGRAARAAGALCLAALVLALARPALGAPAAAALAAALAALAAWRFPELVLRRIAFAVPSLVLLVYATTLLMFRAPGNPFARERTASPQVEAALRAHYGVPESGTAFFAIYVRRLVVDGSLGPSIKVQGRSVEDLLLPALPVSASLGLVSLVLACAIGIGLGLRAGLRPGSAADHASMGLALVGISLPNFVIGAALLIVFALALGWLPVAGWGGYRHLALPAVTLALPYAAYIARLARSGTIEVMREGFVRTARAKGLPERAVVLRHALRGALLPVVSFLGPAAAGILTGSFVVEVLFGVPGMGQWFVKGAINRDYSVVLGTAIVYFALIVSFNLLVDLAYAWLDPRVRDAEAAEAQR
jgi:oligopeptide transport system permease protein